MKKTIMIAWIISTHKLLSSLSASGSSCLNSFRPLLPILDSFAALRGWVGERIEADRPVIGIILHEASAHEEILKDFPQI